MRKEAEYLELLYKISEYRKKVGQEEMFIIEKCKEYIEKIFEILNITEEDKIKAYKSIGFINEDLNEDGDILSGE